MMQTPSTLTQSDNCPLCYILVLNYCSTEDTLACVSSIRRINYPNFQLLVIDNNSPDGGGEVLAANLPADELLRLTSNTGYAGGNNAGFDVALRNNAEYVLVVNPDVRLPPDSLSAYISALKQDETFGALNPVQIAANGTVDNGFSQAVLATSQPIEGHDNQDLLEATTLFGAALVLPSRTLRLVGGFDPLFFAYGEEEDLCRRIRSRGLKLVVTSLSPVTHHRTKEGSGVSDFVLFLRLKGTYLYSLKNPQLGFRYALKHFLRDFLRDIFGRRKSIYPFNRYPIKAFHIIRAGYWVLRNIERIRQHRKLDKTQGPYISEARR